MRNVTKAGENALTWPWVVAFASLAVFHRLVPYLFSLGTEAQFAWNFVPVGAVGLFAGARWRTQFAFLTPLAVMLISDLLLWPFLAAKGYAAFGWGRPIIYASFTFYALIGRLIRDQSPWWIAPAAFVGALQFFLISNFAVWMGSDDVTYARSVSGLIQCYAAGLPFFGNTLGGDLGFSGLFFGLHALGLVVWQREKAGQPA